MPAVPGHAIVVIERRVHLPIVANHPHVQAAGYPGKGCDGCAGSFRVSSGGTGLLRFICGTCPVVQTRFSFHPRSAGSRKYHDMP
jgi:hypothetical protein